MMLELADIVLFMMTLGAISQVIGVGLALKWCLNSQEFSTASCVLLLLSPVFLNCGIAIQIYERCQIRKRSEYVSSIISYKWEDQYDTSCEHHNLLLDSYQTFRTDGEQFERDLVSLKQRHDPTYSMFKQLVRKYQLKLYELHTSLIIFRASMIEFESIKAIFKITIQQYTTTVKGSKQDIKYYVKRLDNYCLKLQRDSSRMDKIVEQINESRSIINRITGRAF
ncbi:uncharacterized protein RJT21DRAFT_139549 [Scheffersomyces amazonensis]|uniref:uncharacterized protein n=1 Tax=Scheffersomyces amazonensis TaxID=1078765 RepID=UPI00315DD2FF